MNATPRRGSTTSVRGWVIAQDGSIVIECEVTHPKSGIGKSVDVVVQGDQIDDLLAIVRRGAARRRSDPLDEPRRRPPGETGYHELY